MAIQGCARNASPARHSADRCPGRSGLTVEVGCCIQDPGPRRIDGCLAPAQLIRPASCRTCRAALRDAPLLGHSRAAGKRVTTSRYRQAAAHNVRNVLDLLVHGGLIIDGTGSPGFHGAVAIEGDSLMILRGEVDAIPAA